MGNGGILFAYAVNGNADVFSGGFQNAQNNSGLDLMADGSITSGQLTVASPDGTNTTISYMGSYGSSQQADCVFTATAVKA